MTTPPNLKKQSAAYMQTAYNDVWDMAPSPGRAQAFATMALALEQRRAADALEAILEKLNLVRIESESLSRDY